MSTPICDTVYIGGIGRVYALSALDGGSQWICDLDETRRPFVEIVGAEGDVVYVYGMEGHDIYAIDASEGYVLWRYHTALFLRRPVIANGVVYAGIGLDARNGRTGEFLWRVDTTLLHPLTMYLWRLYNAGHAISAFDLHNGNEFWRYQIAKGWIKRNWAISSPLVSDAVVYAPWSDGTLYAVNAATGTLRWQAKPGRLAPMMPIGGDGIVYVCADNALCALSATEGSVLWRFRGRPNDMEERAGVVYMSSSDRNIYALNGSSGEVLWRFSDGKDIRLVAAVDGVIYASSGRSFTIKDDYLYALDGHTGTMLWKFQCRVFEISVVGQIVFVTYPAKFGSETIHRVAALNAQDGRMHWAANAIYLYGNPVLGR